MTDDDDDNDIDVSRALTRKKQVGLIVRAREERANRSNELFIDLFFFIVDDQNCSSHLLEREIYS